MSQQVICDRCDKVLDPEDEHLWIKVGWRVTHHSEWDACSPKCAREIVTELARDQKRIDREIEAEEA